MMTTLRRRPRLLASILLVVVSMAWGATFVVVQHAIVHVPVVSFLAWRFVLAGGLLALCRPKSLVRLGRRGWLQGAALGLALAAGYVLQTVGLRYTGAAVSGFLTGLQVVFTPLLAWGLLRRRPAPRTGVAVVVATTGLAVLSLHGLAMGYGGVLTVASAALFALQIVGLDRWASVEDAYGLAAVQLLTVGAVCLAAAAPHGVGLPTSGSLWGAVVLTAVAATAFAFVVQSWAQSHLSATAAAVVFTMEPLFAALFAWTAGEQLGWRVVAGGALVVGAMLVLGSGRAVRGRAAAPLGAPPPADPGAAGLADGEAFA